MAFNGFVNLTPFAAAPLLLSDERGGDVLVCVVKATFALHHVNGATTTRVADEQAPICLKPVHHGEPGVSSVKFDSDAVLCKLGTDVVLVGHAYAPVRGSRYADVSMSVGGVRSTIRVFGDRVWTSALGRWIPSVPEPFEMMPLTYERAFGGWDRTSDDASHHDFETRNPVGVGFVSRKRGVARAGMPLPNLEDPSALITSPTDRPAPAGFGFIAANWEPRTSYAGTYDDAWRARRMPLLPDDFNRRFYSSAHPSLALHGFLRGGEPVEVVNASPRGTVRFQLPFADPFASMQTADGAIHRSGMVLDTVILDLDRDACQVVWRGAFSVAGSFHDVVWAKVQCAGQGPALS